MNMLLAKLLIPVFATACALTASASGDFNSDFNDKTLRLDYIFAADATGSHVYLKGQSSWNGWAGRRHNMDKLPYIGNGTVTVRDEATGDTLYRNSFSSLYHEWLSTDEAKTTAKAFNNSFLVPAPKRPALIDLEILDSRHRPFAKMIHRHDPADILIKNADKAKFPYRYTHKGGDPSTCIDIVILPEGYTTAEMDSFRRHAEIATKEILSYKPFIDHADKINFLAVEVPSADSGVSIPRKDEWKNTAFSSHFSTFYSDRYLTTSEVSDIHEALTGIPYEHIIILANTEEYGGGGIYNSYTLTAARNPYFRPVVVHEFGHSFGGLADEYFYEGDVMEDTYPFDVEPWEPNITTLKDFGSKWESILKKGTPIPTPPEDKDRYDVGVFEGGGYSFKNIYRPAYECRMRNNHYPEFCPACQRALDILIRFYTE